MQKQGDRFNANKPRLCLDSPFATQGRIRVLEFGCVKYDAWNWCKGLPLIEVLESTKRHIAAIMKGEIFDEDSNLPHVDHIQCNAMFMSHYHHTGTQDYTGFPPYALEILHEYLKKGATPSYEESPIVQQVAKSWQANLDNIGHVSNASDDWQTRLDRAD